VQFPVVLQREEVVVRVDDPDPSRRLDLPRRRRSGPADMELERRLFLVAIQREHQRLEVLDDLVHVLHHPGYRLVLMDDAIHAERPDGRAPERRQQDAPDRVPQRLAEATLQRRDQELGRAPILRALGDLDALRQHQPGEI